MLRRIVSGIIGTIRTEIAWFETRRFLRSRQLTLVRR